MTLAATNAAAFATTDRDATATRILTAAVRDVIRAYRRQLTNDRAAGLDWPLPVTTAAIALNTATIRADRMLGDTTAAEVRQRGEGR